jgi:hypothetical protein
VRISAGRVLVGTTEIHEPDVLPGYSSGHSWIFSQSAFDRHGGTHHDDDFTCCDHGVVGGTTFFWLA